MQNMEDGALRVFLDHLGLDIYHQYS
jgi:hypothetical protein